MIKVHWPSWTRKRSMFLSFKRVDQVHAFYDSQETVLNDLCCTACRCFIRCDHRHSDCAGCLAWRRLFFGKRWWFQRMGFRTWILATDLNRVALQLFALIECWSHARSYRDASLSQTLNKIQIITKRYLSHHGPWMPLWVWRFDTEAGINASTIINHWPIDLDLGCAASLHLSLGWPYQDDSWESEPTDLESSIGDKGMVGGDDWQVDFEPNGALVMELESEGFGVRVGGFDNAETCRITWWLSYSLSPHVQDFAMW